jgi:hypothetical protein
MAQRQPSGGTEGWLFRLIDSNVPSPRYFVAGLPLVDEARVPSTLSLPINDAVSRRESTVVAIVVSSEVCFVGNAKATAVPVVTTSFFVLDDGCRRR